MPKAIRYRKVGGPFLQHTLFWTNADYIGAYHAQPEVFNADLAAEEEALTIASHKEDFAVAFGVNAADIEAVIVEWDGDEAGLPKAADASAPIQRLAVKPSAVPSPTPIEQIKAALIADPALSAETKAAIQAISGGADRAGGVPMMSMKG